MKNKQAEQRFPLRRVATGTLILAMLTGHAMAADALSADSEWMFGDWGGYRTQLQNDGIKFDVNYTMESAANLGGGADTNTTMRYSDQWSFGTNFDLEKLLDWQDAEFQMTITNRDGQNLSEQVADKRTGMLSSVQEVYGRGQTWRLTQFWLRKGLFNDVVDLKAGRVTVGEDFDNFDGNLFQNLALGSGQAGNWRGDRWFNWPVSQWGGRIKLNITPEVFFQVGFYNQNRANYDRGDGFRLDTSNSEGNLVPVELGWKPTLGAQKLPGNYRIGYYYSSANGDVYGSWRNGAYQDQDHAYGGYLLLQQQLTAQDGDVNRGLGVRVQAVMNDHKTSKTDNYQSIAFTWKGPFDARPDDEIGVGAARIHVNSDYTRSLRQQNQANGESSFDSPTYLPIQDGSEYNYEVYYNAKVTNWMSLRPNLQYVVAPGAVSEVKDAFIGGISANIAF
ncbi:MULTISPECIES: carbohydrate porin [Pantoea]|uniref:Carbohydrate porin n=1 Tax=Pantoea brenneri TaxID=472694 RepID=A0A7Y6NGB2_9GAMM|nr:MULTISPECIES: carbohydrate porin [Pantoea]KKD32760.1 porin [Pantoea sp. 3.5.1]MBZ6395015.1 carbohydrate porin [Pantoea sp.]MBZ6437954.1 carbohydrate porin [Pantoea sp.]MCQ5472691.1 carbohydrate porin [Pantoea brenneri]MDH1087428.1 carbohydrate porin [Pantoea brenneri]